MPSPQQDQPSLARRLGRKFAASRFLTTSLIIHLALVSVLGSVVMFKVAMKPDSFEAVIGTEPNFLQETDVSEPVPEPEEFAEFTVADPQVAPPSVSQSAISSLSETTSTWSTSASMEHMTFGNTLSSGKTLAAAVGTGGNTASGVSTRMSGSLYGVKIDANKLGVILDVSGSAHKYLLLALAEVDRFKGAQIILYPGCGMGGESKKKDFEMTPARSVSSRFETDKDNVKVVFGQIWRWMKGHPKDHDRIKRLLASENVMVSVNDPSIPQITGCQFAFEQLIKDGADTIYWFADFGDGVDPQVAEALARKLKARGIRVIAHNFTGGKVRTEAMLIVEKTGGEAISKVPGR